MRSVREERYGDVRALELGYGLVGRPWMTVRLYRVGGFLIDSGQAHMRKEALDWLARDPPGRLLLTHHHEDHGGNAAAVAERFGVPVFASSVILRKLSRGHRILPYQRMVWGRSLPVAARALPEFVEDDDFRLEAIPTPGHSRDHTVFLDAARGRLFSGDLYLGDRIKFMRADENLPATIASLKTVLSRDFDALFCAHRPVPENGRRHLARKLAFLEEIFGLVLEGREKGWSETETLNRLPVKENRRVLWLTAGNVSARNMVRSVLKNLSAG